MNRRTFLVSIASAAGLAACSPRLVYLPEPVESGPYLLASGDRLRIIVFGQDNLSNVYAVDGRGCISMPLIGSVAVAGLSTTQVNGAIEAGLRKGFLREPKVTVEIDAYRPFFILGEVVNAGQYAFVNGMTVQTAVAIAGGFTPRGNKSAAEVTRHTPAGPVTGLMPITYTIRPGDTIMIKERWF
jgi:polysaccharide export outer membrane protein